MKNHALKITIGAMCVALSSFVLSLFTIKITQSFQIGFSEFPLMASGAILGPIYGGIVGLAKDVLTMLKYGYGPSLFTLAPMILGIVPGIALVIFGKKKFYSSVVIIFVTVIIAMMLRTGVILIATNTMFGVPWKALLIELPFKLGINVVEAIVYTIIFKIVLPQVDSILGEKV